MFIARWVHSFLSKHNVGDFLRLKLVLFLVHLRLQHFSGKFDKISKSQMWEQDLFNKSSLAATFDWKLLYALSLLSN